MKTHSQPLTLMPDTNWPVRRVKKANAAKANAVQTKVLKVPAAKKALKALAVRKALKALAARKELRVLAARKARKVPVVEMPEF